MSAPDPFEIARARLSHLLSGSRTRKLAIGLAILICLALLTQC